MLQKTKVQVISAGIRNFGQASSGLCMLQVLYKMCCCSQGHFQWLARQNQTIKKTRQERFKQWIVQLLFAKETNQQFVAGELLSWLGWKFWKLCEANVLDHVQQILVSWRDLGTQPCG